MLDIIARLSSRVFLGDELCRNEGWLRITKRYTLTIFSAAAALRMYPGPLRKLMQWFLPMCKRLRAEFAEARDTIAPVVEKRRQLRQAAREAGKLVPTFDDALDWADQEAGTLRESYNPAIFQLTLSVAAIHTSTDLLLQVVLDLAQHPEFFEPLREEISSVLRADGWKKTSLYNMKLLDSVMKESQRMKPIGFGEHCPLIPEAVKTTILTRDSYHESSRGRRRAAICRAGAEKGHSCHGCAALQRR